MPAFLADFVLLEQESGPNEVIVNFNQSVREFYDADVEVSGLATSGKEVTDRINRWVEEKGRQVKDEEPTGTFMATNHNTGDSNLLVINSFFFRRRMEGSV